MSVKLPSHSEIEEWVSHYYSNSKVFLSASQLETLDIPSEWSDLLRQQEYTGSVLWPKGWEVFGNKLPTVLRFFQTSILTIAVLASPSGPSLLYVFRSLDGEIGMFQGFPPTLDFSQHLWLPGDLANFYRSVHNGWFYLPSGAMGPLPQSEMIRLTDTALDLPNGLPFNPAKVFRLFGNGAGDFLCIDSAVSDPGKQGVIYWHDDPLRPDAAQDIWAVMNAWIGIFLEDAAPAR